MGVRGVVRTLIGIKLPLFVEDSESIGPKQPNRDKFNDIHYLADTERLIPTLRESTVNGENCARLKRFKRDIRMA